MQRLKAPASLNDAPWLQSQLDQFFSNPPAGLVEVWRVSGDETREMILAGLVPHLTRTLRLSTYAVEMVREVETELARELDVLAFPDQFTVSFRCPTCKGDCALPGWAECPHCGGDGVVGGVWDEFTGQFACPDAFDDFDLEYAAREETQYEGVAA